jgi:arylsulfatase A-like enzyme
MWPVADKLDELGVCENIIVVFTTDNGAEVLSWPDGGSTRFRGKKTPIGKGGWRYSVSRAGLAPSRPAK